MPTIQSKYNINGLIDTTRTIIDNIETIASAAGAWATYDIHQGLWSFIKNEDTSPVYHFDDSNIIGSISMSGSSLTETYNSVEVQFPHKDLNDQKDYRRVSIPQNQWNTNERPNKLIINMDHINDPIQAEMHALRELKQSRMNEIIEFNTDFNALGLNAGDIITVSSDILSMFAKKFRVVRISEQETPEGDIVLGITGQEWDDYINEYLSVYRYKRERNTSIALREANTDIIGSDNDALKSQNFSQLFPSQYGISTSVVQTSLASYGNPGFGASGYTGGNPFFIEFSVNVPLSNMVVTAGAPIGTYSYEYYDGSAVATRTGTYAFIPCLVNIFFNGNNIGEYTVDWQTSAVTFSLNNVQPGNIRITYEPLPTYDLNQGIDNRIFHFDHVVFPDSAGNGITVNILGFDV